MGFVACLIAIVAVGMGAELASVPRSDIAYLVYAAERVLGGARLYVDVVEINPPLIILLNMPAVLIARAVGASDILVYRILVMVSLLGVLALVDRCLRDFLAEDGGALRRRLMLVVAYALFLAAGDDFGQREHLLVALTLPYVLLAVGRLASRPAPAVEATVSGLLAGIGLALKPHFLVVWVAVEGYVAWRLRARRLSCEAVGAAAFLACYVVGVALITPQYLELVRQLGPAYSAYGHTPFVDVLVTAPGTTLCFLAVLAWIALRSAASHRELWTVLLLAVFASFVAGATQQKGWGYHFYPARVFALMLLALAVLDARRPIASAVRRLYVAAAYAALGSSALSSSWLSATRILHRDHAREAEHARLNEEVAAVRRYAPPGGSLYVMSYTNESGFPLVNYSGVRWASRFPHHWIIEAVYQHQLYAPEPLRFHSRRQMAPVERYLIDAVYEDLTRNRPDLLMVLRHARDVRENAVRRFDYVGYFNRDPRIAAALRQYRRVDQVGEYVLYVKATSPAQAGAPPSAEPGIYDVRISRTEDGGLPIAGLVFDGMLFLALAGCAYALERPRAQRDGAAATRA